MKVTNAPGQTLNLGYHDPVWSVDPASGGASPEGGQVGLPVVGSPADTGNTALILVVLALLYLMSKG